MEKFTWINMLTFWLMRIMAMSIRLMKLLNDSSISITLVSETEPILHG